MIYRITFLLGFLLGCFSETEAQINTVIHDGYLGFIRKYYHDTLTVYKVHKNGPAEKAGIRDNDMILQVDGHKVTGAGLRSWEIAGLLNGAGGSGVRLIVLHEGEEEPVEVNMIRDTLTNYQKGCYYEYLYDPEGLLVIEDVLSDSVQDLFTNPLEEKVIVASLKEGSNSQSLGIRPGDRLINLYSELDNSYSETDLFWGGVEYSFLRKDFRDSVLTVERGDSIFNIVVDMASDPLEGMTSRAYDSSREGFYWLKINLSGELTRDRDFLFDFPFEDSVIVYIPRDSMGFDHFLTGFDVPRKYRAYSFRDWNVVRIPVENQSRFTVYARIQKLEQYFVALPVIWYAELDAVKKLDQSERFVMGLLLGMLLIISFYYLVLFFNVKDWSYLLYAIFILSISLALYLNKGFAHEFLPDDQKWSSWGMSIPFQVIAALSFLGFGVLYLELRSSHRIWLRVAKVVFWITFPAALILGTDYYIVASDVLRIIRTPLEIIVATGAVLAGTVIIIPTILRIRKGFSPAWYFLAAHLLLVAFILFYNSEDWIVYHFSHQPDWIKIAITNSVQLGVVVTILLFAAALGQKMQKSDKERREAQARIILQLKENEQLKDKVNRELEQKVLERTREIVEQKEEIEAQRDEIEAQRDQLHYQHQVVVAQKQELTDSITYAERIQSAILPDPASLGTIMPEHFILFRPRDIVSGDFYWIKAIKNFLVVVAADCTGHGVPGAFMSMLGVSLLNEVIGSRGFDRPGEILNRLRRKLKETLRQEEDVDGQKDGMDMALLVLDRETRNLEYAGAYNPLYLVRKGRAEDPPPDGMKFLEGDGTTLYEVKADRQPIGIYTVEKGFTSTSLNLKEHDSLYIFSDGFVDQKGGPHGKKFLSKRFKQKLLEIQDLSMDDQKKKLDGILDNWMEGQEQIDDILVMGLRV